MSADTADKLRQYLADNNKEKIAEIIQEQQWHHSFEIYPGISTHGTYDPSSMFDWLQLPDNMTGLRLADIGASNGYYALQAYKRGASVTTFDYRNEFDSLIYITKILNNMNTPHYCINVLDDSILSHNKFDIVLFLGVLYHLPDPIKALSNILPLVKSKIFIESLCIDNNIILKDGTTTGVDATAPNLSGVPIAQYLPNPSVNSKLSPYGDASNFWGYSSSFFEYVLKDFGFNIVRKHINETRILLEAIPDDINHPNVLLRKKLAYGTMSTS